MNTDPLRGREMSNTFETQFGEGFAGDGVNAAHINTVLGATGGPVEVAWASALAQPSQGHVPFVTVLRPGLPVKPFTLFVNKASLVSDGHAQLTWGAAQAGVAAGVADAVASGIIDAHAVDSLLLIAAVWVNPAADDADAVFANNHAATYHALRAGRDRQPALDEVLAARSAPFNPFFRSPGAR
jgi:5,6,7,8-tetrahydromethanopterin hydro-lyase